MANRRLRVISSFVVFAIATVVGFLLAQSFLAQDACLDAGGSWLAGPDSCDFGGAGPHNWLDRMWATTLTAGLLSVGVGLVLGAATLGFLGGFRSAA